MNFVLRIRTAPIGTWQLLAIVLSLAASSLLADRFTGQYSDTPVDPKERAKYALEIEKMWRSLELSPIKLEKSMLVAGDVVKPACVVVNKSTANLPVPVSPGSPAGGVGHVIAGVEWTLRRLDGKSLANCPGPGYGAASVNPKCFCLFRGYIYQEGLFAPNQSTQNIPVWDIDVTKHNLVSGKYELAVNCSVPDAGYAKVFAKKTVVFEVDNPSALTPEQIKKAAEDLAARQKAASKVILSSFRLGDLVASATSIPQGTSFNVQADLTNVSKNPVVVPAGAMPQHVPFSQQWYISKVPGERKPWGGWIFGAGTKDASGDVTIPAGDATKVGRSIATDGLEPGMYEVSVDVTDCSGASVGLRKQKFKVTK